jgi:hypothetical protein
MEEEEKSTLTTPTMRDLKRFGVGTAVYIGILAGGIVVAKVVGFLVGLL